MSKSYQLFFKEIENFQNTFKSSIEKEKKGQELTNEFLTLMSQNIHGKKISKTNPLYTHLEQVNQTLEKFILDIQKEWNNLNLSKELSQNFGDKLVFFVFGKVNAGKSSFSNLFTELSEIKSEIFYLDKENKTKSNSNSHFKVGQTETTARIQWVELGSLILVDSPGLHSITGENATLTKKYLDSADAIIWLTSSGSPGQVQELEELAREMRKEKPILPIITKSDLYEEDWCDETEKIVKKLTAKDKLTREAQEKDVKKRAGEVLTKLNSKSTLLTPISISSQCAKEGMVEESNIEILFKSLNNNILKNAIEYKSEKPKKLLIKYFELEIIEKVDKHLVPNIQQLKKNIRQQQIKLEDKKRFLSNTLLADINYKILSLVKKHEQSKNTQQLTEELNEYVARTFNSEISKVLKELFSDIKQTTIKLNPNSVAKYENVEFSYTVRGRERGFWDKLSSFDWSDRESDYTETEVIGIDGSAVTTSLRNNIKKEITSSIEDVFSDFNQTFESLVSNISSMEREVEKFKTKIKELKNEN